jgi:tetratricopeptide (TPR) repeat protein
LEAWESGLLSTPEQAPPLLDSFSASFSADELLKPPGEDPIVLETYRPLGQSLDWELGQLFYRQRGNTAFLNGEVPYLVNNDGVLAARAAALFFTSIEERGPADRGDLLALEFGAGSCLFARGFLLAFERLSKKTGRDYHERLIYVLADHSGPMLEDASKSGVFPPGCRVVFARADAVQQLFETVEGVLPAGATFDAIFLNYVLDCLPAMILRRKEDGIERLCIQTELSPANPLLRDLPGARKRAMEYASGANPDPSCLIDLYPIFRLRYRYEIVRDGHIPFFRAAAPLLDDNNPLLHSYGAIACLEASLQNLRPGGFILFSDYGTSASGDQPKDLMRLFHQHFGSSTAIGLNLRQLRDYLTGIPDANYAEPPSDDESLTVRLAGRGVAERVTLQFGQLFNRDELERLRAPRKLAREYRSAGAQQLALECYVDAIRLQPENWDLKGEAARFCETALRLHESALELARAALELNPIDPDLWNTLGDCLYSLRRKGEADAAFRWALRLSPANVRARYNLVYTLTDKRDFPGALNMISEALAIDEGGEFAERLLKRQGEIISALKQRRKRIAESMADRYCTGSGQSCISR